MCSSNTTFYCTLCVHVVGGENSIFACLYYVNGRMAVVATTTSTGMLKGITRLPMLGP